MAFEAKEDPLWDKGIDGLNEIADDDVDIEHLIDVDALEACLKDLEEGIATVLSTRKKVWWFSTGKDAPPPDPTKFTVIDADPPEVFAERLQLIQDYHDYPHQPRDKRKLSKDEYNEVRQRWKEFMPDKEPLYFQEIQHFR